MELEESLPTRNWGSQQVLTGEVASPGRADVRIEEGWNEK
jgi:hypothetical protein